MITRATVLRYLRRIHMYASLFMVPWIVLYGSTGFLFNHPTAFQPADGTRVEARSMPPRRWGRKTVSDSSPLGSR